MTLAFHFSALESSGLIHLVQIEPEIEYRFRHALIQEAVYASMLRADRKSLHFAVTEALERAYPDRLDELAPVLGEHCRLAGEVDRARVYFIRAGNVARQKYANAEAIAAYSQALALTIEPTIQIDLYLNQGAVLELVGRWKEAEGNFRNALALSEKIADAVALARCRMTLGVLTRRRDDYSAALEWLEQARMGYEALGDPQGVSEALAEMGAVFTHFGEEEQRYVVAQRHLEESLTLARSLKDEHRMAVAQSRLGYLAALQGDYAAARALEEESLGLRRKISDKRGIASSLDSLGVVTLFQGDYAAARALHEESLTLYREMGDKSGIEMALNSLGCVALVQGDYTAARSLHEENLALARELGVKSGIARSLDNLGLVAFAQGEFTTAQILHGESLVVARETSDRQRTAYIMLELAGVAAALGHFRRAVCLAAAAEAQRVALNLSWEPLVHPPYERAVASVRTVLDEDEFSEAWTQGQKMTQEEAVEYALHPDDSVE